MHPKVEYRMPNPDFFNNEFPTQCTLTSSHKSDNSHPKPLCIGLVKHMNLDIVILSKSPVSRQGKT
jgi:hypothetical protein